MNQVNLVGNLGARPELRYVPGGDAVCDMRLATTERWRSNGEKQEHTEWHRVILWGPMAENAAKYLDKGSKVRVTGRLRTRKWQDRDGNDRYTTEIRADEVEYLTAAGRRDEAPAQDDGQADPGSGQDDDIPFDEGGAPAEVEAPREVTQRAAAPAQRGSGASAPAASRAPAKSAGSSRVPAKRAQRGR